VEPRQPTAHTKADGEVRTAPPEQLCGQFSTHSAIVRMSRVQERNATNSDSSHACERICVKTPLRVADQDQRPVGRDIAQQFERLGGDVPDGSRRVLLKPCVSITS
jgi:hypothetical protein